MVIRRALFVIVALTLAGRLLVAQNDADNARIQQYVQLLTPAMWQELNFVRQVCDLTPEQRPKVRAAGDAAAKEGAKAIMKPIRGGSQPTIGAQAIRDSLHDALKQTLTSEQLEHFEAEDAKRTEAQKKATILGVVMLLDTFLFLSEEQREKIVANLDKNWQREWEQWLMIHRYSGQYAPQVPDQHVVPLLNEEQKLVWSGLQKISTNAWHHNNQPQNEDPWWNWNPQKAKPAAAAKANAKNAPGKAALLKAPKKDN
jgi:hypothetical protein